MTFAFLVGYEPALLPAMHEALFTDPLDDAYNPQLEDVVPVLPKKKKRFPSLAALRANAASSAQLHAVCSETVPRAQNGCRDETFFGLVAHKHELERAAAASEPKQEVPLVLTQQTHLAGAAVLGLRKHTRGANESTTHLQNMHAIPMTMMQAPLSDAVPSVKVSKAVKAPPVPRPASSAPRPRATGNVKRPIPRNVQVLIVPVM